MRQKNNILLRDFVMARKPRKTVVILEAAEPVVVTEEMARNGEALVVPIAARVETSYDRAKGPKILRQVPLRGGRLGGQHSDHALLRFERLLACDTSTDDFDGSPLSVASVVQADHRIQGDELIITLRPVAAFEFRGITSEPEKVSWVHLLKELEGQPPATLGLVVDAHLGELSDFITRRKALLDDYMLPDWATLIYATADAGMEHLANKLISHCDKEASKILRFIVDREIGSEGLRAVQHSQYTHMRQWSMGRGERAGSYWIKR